MKVSKEALRNARQFLRLTLKDGKVDTDMARRIVDTVVKAKPRHYIATLEAYHRMLRLELEKRHAIVENASTLENEQCDAILADLRGKLGADVTAEFRHTPELLGGMRVKLGSTVWDSSVKARLDGLAQAFKS
jgi:F-type H+-transporting ATPase subunit delta